MLGSMFGFVRVYIDRANSKREPTDRIGLQLGDCCRLRQMYAGWFGRAALSSLPALPSPSISLLMPAVP